MASSALEEKINKIRQQNEEIRRRYEEVEADKKNAAKLNALVQLVPSDDWPERREPPEFSAPPKTVQKQKSVTKDRENERPTSQHYTGIQERLAKKDHKFAEGEGPPPDPKYNFLADSERETRTAENSKTEEDKNKSRNRTPRGGAGPRRRGGGNNIGGGGSRDAFFKDNRGPQAFHCREESFPEYEAWRAERNRIDEARINRQKTAEGNWRREWDCNKVSLEKDQPRRDFARKDSNTFDRRNNHYDNDYSNRGHGGSRTYHQSQKNYTQDYRHPHHEQPHEFKRQQSDCKTSLSPVDNRTVAAFDQSIKVTVNQGSQANKGTVMSVKVNSPSIAGTGRVGPRQKSRITYSSQSDSNQTTPESNSFMRQKSFDEKTAAANFNNSPKLAPKSPFSQRKKEGNTKSPHFSKREFKSDESARPKSQSKASYSQRNESRDQRQSNNFVAKPQRMQKRKVESNKTGNVFVSEDLVPVENDFNQPIDNDMEITQCSDSIEYEINNIGKEFSDVSNVLDDSAVGGNEVTHDIEENLCDSNIANEGTTDYENPDYVINDQFEDAIEENVDNIIIDANVRDEGSNLIQNEESINVNVGLVDDTIKDQIVDALNHEGIVNESTACEPFVTEAMEVEVKIETSVNTQPLVHETEEIAQMLVETPEVKAEINVNKELSDNIEIKEITHTLDDPTNEKVVIDVESEKEESVIKEQCIEQIICRQGETDDVKNEDSQPSIDLKVEDSKVEDNSANDLIESEENAPADDSLHKVENDSGFLDNAEIDSFNKTSTTGTNDSAIMSDSNIVEDLDALLDKTGAELAENKSDEIFPETAKSDIVDITKDDCKEIVEICDNVTVATCDMQMNEDNEKTKLLENSVKDNEATIVENDHQNSEASNETIIQEENAKHQNLEASKGTITQEENTKHQHSEALKEIITLEENAKHQNLEASKEIMTQEEDTKHHNSEAVKEMITQEENAKHQNLEASKEIITQVEDTKHKNSEALKEIITQEENANTVEMKAEDSIEILSEESK